MAVTSASQGTLKRVLLRGWLGIGLLAAQGAGVVDDPIQSRLEALRSRAGLPALGGAIVTSEGLQEAWVTGVRAAGRDEKVLLGDRWSLASCTKAMTATLIALLVERGDFGWDATLPQLLPDLADSIHEGFADVTVVDLLTHRAGIEDDMERDGVWLQCLARGGSPSEQRRALTRAALSWGPACPPRTKFEYSSGGVAIAGHVAESLTGKPFEALMQELLFGPLGMTTAAFGAPGCAARIDEPRGHGADLRPVELGGMDGNVPAAAPAGTCMMSLQDWARFVGLHLRGAKGDVKVGDITLHAATMKKLHTPIDGPGSRYAMGWFVEESAWAKRDGIVLTHAGTNTLWFARVKLAPADGFAVLVVTNAGIERAPAATEGAATLLIRKHLQRGARIVAKKEGER